MSETRPLFTVVMPAYGVEKYLTKAVESIKSQTFSDWELIIVEDGSPDKTGELAEKLKETDARIKVVHHEKNKGLSEARNTGIEHASGRYIWFMDPDDTVDHNLLEQVAGSLEKTGHDWLYLDILRNTTMKTEALLMHTQFGRKNDTLRIQTRFIII